MQSKSGKTQQFTVSGARELEVRKVMESVYQSLVKKGYDPVNQISGYILTGDPTYITNHDNARSLIVSIDRDELMNVLVRYYISAEN